MNSLGNWMINLWRCPLVILVVGCICVGCQAGPSPVVLPTETPVPTETMVPTVVPTSTPVPAPTATPTPSLEERYGIPAGWQLVQAEPPEDERADWTTVMDGLRFALPAAWSCHETPDDAGTTYICILDESADRFENQRKTKLQVDSYRWRDATVLSDFVPDVKENMRFYGYDCESSFFTIDDLEAASVACTNPAYDDQIDYDTDREAYGEANARQVPTFFVLILNGDRVEQFHFRTWDKSQMPALFEDLIPYIGYGTDG